MDRRDFIKSVTALSAADTLLNFHGAMALDAPRTSLAARMIDLRPDDVTTIMGERGQLTRGLKSCTAVSGFDSPQASVVWTVNAPKEDDYAAGLIFSTPEQSQIEVRAGESVLRTQSLPRTWEDRPFYWRQELPGLLHLKAGKNRITFRLPEAKHGDAPKPGDCGKHPGSQLSQDFSLWSIELGTPDARKSQLVRAKEIRGDASWMISGKYGQFVHWSPEGYAFNGNQPRWQWNQKAVKMFNVKVFADAVERTGAAWIVFTVTHAGFFFWPGPSESVDKVLPGRTAKRDLLGEIIAELDRRGIRTLFYMDSCIRGLQDPEWAKALGALDADTTKYGSNIEAILRESSLRYGKKLHGYGYYDNAFSVDYALDPPWEGWARAIKAGNPAAVVGFSSSRGPDVSPFSELSVTDGGSRLIEPDLALIGPGRQLGDVTPAWWCAMDGWIFKGPMNGKIGNGPRHPAQDYVSYFQQMAEAKIPVTINLIITADVTSKHPIFNDRCVAVMDEVRKTIRGK